MNISTIKNANTYLHQLARISSIKEAASLNHDVFLLPQEISFSYRNDHLIETSGLGKLDNKPRDLIRVIKIIDALNISYSNTNVLTPLAFAEQLKDIPYHITTQAILFFRVDTSTLKWIRNIISKKTYGKHIWDQFWLPFSKPIDTVKPGEILCIFNRRVGGWDGTPERPVIELLGAGGHLPHVWDDNKRLFRQLRIRENIVKELHEELGLEIEEKNVTVFGGYENHLTHELVILCGEELNTNTVRKIQEYAVQNIDENTQGIYLGTFTEVINFYKKTPEPFAGGSKAAPYNFPNNEELMLRATKYMKCSTLDK